MESIANKEYWKNHWSNTGFEIVSETHPVRIWIEKEVPYGKGELNCLEIGCYPGKFLAVFGKRGYRLNGVDMYEKMYLMPDWLSDQGFILGNFYQADFLNFQANNVYDIVCSFGFIEHFKNWQEVINKHVDLTRKGGLIIIEVPNLKSPLYYFLYKLFEPEVLKNHVLSAMSIDLILDVLKSKRCEVRSSQYIGKFYFRFVTKHNLYTSLVTFLINSLGFLFNLLPSSISSRYMGIVAIKR